MDKTGLHNAMKYGAQIRNDLASLGKFGLGLKTASSSVCLKYSIISKNDVARPLEKLTWDLEHVMEINKWEMYDDPITDEEREFFGELCGEVGTLVVWEKCDRLLSKAYEEPGGVKEKRAMKYRADKLADHCALIFHKYLNPDDKEYGPVNISINGEKVSHWNPFYPQRSEQVLSPNLTSLPVQLEDGSVEYATVCLLSPSNHISNVPLALVASGFVFIDKSAKSTPDNVPANVTSYVSSLPDTESTTETVAPLIEEIAFVNAV